VWEDNDEREPAWPGPGASAEEEEGEGEGEEEEEKQMSGDQPGMAPMSDVVVVSLELE